MFCYQCEQTAQGKGGTTFGVCGKTPDVSALQDLLIYILRGISQLSVEAKKIGIKDEKMDLFGAMFGKTREEAVVLAKKAMEQKKKS